MYAWHNKKRSQKKYMGKKYDQSGRYSSTGEKVEVAMGWTHSEKYWNGIREDVKESKVDRVEDWLMN
jgi:hypothetical protein